MKALIKEPSFFSNCGLNQPAGIIAQACSGTVNHGTGGKSKCPLESAETCWT